MIKIIEKNFKRKEEMIQSFKIFMEKELRDKISLEVSKVLEKKYPGTVFYYDERIKTNDKPTLDIQILGKKVSVFLQDKSAKGKKVQSYNFKS